MAKELREIREDGRLIWRYVETTPPARSDLPCPNVISDTMDPVEQVDGRFYTSKRQYRAVGRAHGLIEVGNETQYLRQKRSTDKRKTREERRAALKTAVEKYRAGHRPHRRDPA
jgi:hypothetical protein